METSWPTPSTLLLLFLVLFLLLVLLVLLVLFVFLVLLLLLVLLVFLVLLLLLVLLVLDQFLTACDSVLDTGKVAMVAVLFGFVCLFLFCQNWCSQLRFLWNALSS